MDKSRSPWARKTTYVLGLCLLASASAWSAEARGPVPVPLDQMPELPPGAPPPPTDVLVGPQGPDGQQAFDAFPLGTQYGRGEVGAIDFDGPVVEIDGLRYGFAINPDIRFLSGAGAPTLLEPGMAVEFYYVEADFAGQRGKIHSMLEMPEGSYQPE